MPQAPRKRPQQHTVLRSFRAHLLARPVAVFAALDERMRPDDAGGILYTADPAAFLVIVQGTWWYRGEYRVVPDDTGSNLELAIVNVARRARPISRLVGRRALAAAPREFDALARALRLELE